MTKQEFTGQFDRLCKGLDYASTPEQTEAIFRRIGHIGLSVWAESVTTLLCDGRKGYLPKLEHVLSVVDAEAEHQRKAAVERDKPRARSVLDQLSQAADEEMRSKLPTPKTPLFACIKAFASREAAGKRLTNLAKDTRHSDAWIDQERIRLDGLLLEAEQDIAQYSPLIDDQDAARLVTKYETTV